MTVVFVLIDGMRPDAIEAANCETLMTVMKNGAYTLNASSVMPSFTLPCHTTIFHSVPPTRHGIITNDWSPMARPVPGLIDVANTAGRRCGMIFNWEQLRDMARPGSMTASYCLNTAEQDIESDAIMVREAAALITEHQLDFAFVYLGTVDTVGHWSGWMSDEYLAQVAKVDGFVGQLFASLPEDTTYLIQSDHGGHDRTHGTEMPEDMTIPWLVKGPKIRAGHEIQASVSLLDTAPTIARLLDVDAPSVWEGQVIEEIFA